MVFSNFWQLKSVSSILSYWKFHDGRPFAAVICAKQDSTLKNYFYWQSFFPVGIMG